MYTDENVMHVVYTSNDNSSANNRLQLVNCTEVFLESLTESKITICNICEATVRVRGRAKQHSQQHYQFHCASQEPTAPKRF